jgi:hypothetical protein
MKWLIESKGILSHAGEMLEPVLDGNGQMIKGYQLESGDFKVDQKGPDILHQPIPGQECLPDDHPKVMAHLARRVKTIDQRVEDIMNSAQVVAARAILNSNGAADERARAALRTKIQAEDTAAAQVQQSTRRA